MKHRSTKNYGFYKLQKSKFLTKEEEIGPLVGFLLQKFIKKYFFLEYSFACEDFTTKITILKKPFSLRGTNFRAFPKRFFTDFVGITCKKSLLLQIKSIFDENLSKSRLIWISKSQILTLVDLTPPKFFVYFQPKPPFVMRQKWFNEDL